MITLGAVGAGGWGRNLIRNFASLKSAKLKWVCDTDPKQLQAIGQAYPGIRVTENLEDVLSDAETTAVVVATPVPTHFDVAERVLQRKKDLFVEKPLSLSVSQSLTLCDLAEAEGRILMVGHLLLYHPVVQRLKSLLDSGELGQLRYLVSQRLNLGVVRRDENAWWSLAPHDVAVINYLLGSSPVDVTASGGVFVQSERGIEDVVFASLHYPAGKMAHIHVSWLDPHKRRTLTLVGDKKMAVFDDSSADQKLIIFDKSVQVPATLDYTEAVRVRAGDIHIPAVPMREPLLLECESFVEAVQTRQPPLASGRSAVEVVRVLAAGSQSLREGSRRVAVNEVSQ